MEDEFQYKGVKQDRSSSPSFSLDHGDETPQPWNRPHPFKREQNTFLKLDNYLYWHFKRPLTA